MVDPQTRAELRRARCVQNPFLHARGSFFAPFNLELQVVTWQKQFEGGPSFFQESSYAYVHTYTLVHMHTQLFVRTRRHLGGRRAMPVRYHNAVRLSYSPTSRNRKLNANVFREVVRGLGRGGWRATPSRPTRPHGGKHFATISSPQEARARLTRSRERSKFWDHLKRIESDKQGVVIQLGTWLVSKAELQESVVVPGVAGQRSQRAIRSC